MIYIVRRKYNGLGARGFQSGVAKNFFLGVVFGKTLMSEKQISGILKNTHGQNYLVAYVRLLITAPWKRPGFRQFFGFSRKNQRHLSVLFFDILYNILRVFFTSFQGVTNNYPLETPQNRPQNTNFLNIHQIKIRTLLQKISD